MPDLSQTQPNAFICEGYRRINGFRKHVNHIVPQTASSSEKVLMVAFFNNNIMAARGEKIFTSASVELATAIASATGMTG